MKTRTIKLVCLDLGGVLIRVCRDWPEACGRAGVTVPANLAQLARDLGQLSYGSETGCLSHEAFDTQAGALLGLRPTQITAIANAWLCGTYPDASNLVDRLTVLAGLQVACLSNTNARHWQLMDSPGEHYLGLHRLHYRFFSHEIGHMKPAEEIYRHVERATGLAGESILFFDDNIDNVRAARNVGWQAEQIDPQGDPPAEVWRHVARLTG